MSLSIKDPRLAGAIAAVLVIVALVIIVRSGSRNTPPDRSAYYLVEGSSDLIVAEMAPAPVDTSSGSAVRAYVFTCGRCDDESSRFVGYVEKYTSEALAQVGLPDPDYEAMNDGHLVAAADEPWNWTVAGSPEGKAIIDAPGEKCDGVKSCQP